MELFSVSEKTIPAAAVMELYRDAGWWPERTEADRSGHCRYAERKHGNRCVER